MDRERASLMVDNNYGTLTEHAERPPAGGSAPVAARGGQTAKSIKLLAVTIALSTCLLSAVLLLLAVNGVSHGNLPNARGPGGAGEQDRDEVADVPGETLPNLPQDQGEIATGLQQVAVVDTSGAGNVWDALQTLRMTEIKQDQIQVNATLAMQLPETQAQAADAAARAEISYSMSAYNYPSPDLAATNPYPGVAYVGSGYDLLQGYPFPSDGSVDPGFRMPVKPTTYHNGSVSGSGRLVPDGVSVLDNPSADFTFTHHMVSSQSELESMAKTAVELGGSAGFGSFKASFAYNNDFQSASASAANAEQMTSVTQASATVYQARDEEMKINPTLKGLLLGMAQDPSLATKVIKTYGTHFVAKVQMGGRMAQIVTMQTSEVENMQSSEQKKSYEASAGGGLGGFSAEVTGSYASETAAQMRQQAATAGVSMQATFTGGSPALGEADASSLDMSAASAWAASVPTSPVPVKYQLVPIADLITAENLPEAATSGSLTFILQAFNRAMMQYCGSACTSFVANDDPTIIRYGDIVTFPSTSGATAAAAMTGPNAGTTYCTYVRVRNGANPPPPPVTANFCSEPEVPIVTSIEAVDAQPPGTTTCSTTAGTPVSSPGIVAAIAVLGDVIQVSARGTFATWTANGVSINTTLIGVDNNAVNIYFQCSSYARLLSPIPYRNFDRSAVHAGQPFFLMQRNSMLVGDAESGLVRLQPNVSSKFTIVGQPLSSGVQDGSVVRLMLFNASAATWATRFQNTPPALMAKLPGNLLDFLVPQQVANMTKAVELPPAIVAIESQLPDLDFDFYVRRVPSSVQQQLLGTSLPVLAFHASYSHDIQAGATDITLTVEFNSDVFSPQYGDPNLYVATEVGPKPALFAGDFVIGLSADPCGAAVLPALAVNASNVMFTLNGRSPSAYNLRASFAPEVLASAKCLLVTLNPNTQDSAGALLPAGQHWHAQAFQRLAGNVTWICQGPQLVGTVLFHTPVVNADLAFPQPYDFSLHRSGVPLSISRTVNLLTGPTIGMTASSLGTDLYIDIPGTTCPDQLQLSVGPSRLQSPSQPGVFMSTNAIQSLAS